jgi:photosystem II stability/assembly factor-like uncharacterized protein
VGDLKSRKRNSGYTKWIIALSVLLVFIITTIATTEWLTAEAVTEPLAQWEVQDLGGSPDYDFREIAFVNSTHGWVIGVGVLLSTSDSGDTWNTVFEERPLRGLSLISPNDIWVGGDGHLYHSIDAGSSWNRIEGPTEGSPIIKFFNSTHGFAGDVNNLFRTTDGGISWQDVTRESGFDAPIDIHITSKTVRIASWTGLFRSDDWGETWYTEYEGRVNALDFISDNEGWAINGANSYMYFNGEHWIDLEDVHRIGVSNGMYSYDIDFIDSNNGWTVGLNPSVAYTPTGGVTWYEQEWYDVEYGNVYRSVFFLNETHGWVAGYGGVVASTTTGNLLGKRLFSGLFLSSSFTYGGRLIPYTSFFVGTIATTFYLILLLLLARRRFRRRMIESGIADSKESGPRIR